MKKIFLTLTLFVALLSFAFLNVNAKFSYTTKAIKSHTKVVSTDLNGSVTLNQSTITSYNRREIKEEKLTTHKTSWLEVNNNIKDSNVRVVTYTSGARTHWQGKKPSELAKIYEKENPGWIVLGGINGDFFYISDNDEVIGPLMQEGNFYKPYDRTGDWGGHESIGFFDDGRYITGKIAMTSNQFVQVLDEHNVYNDIAEIKAVDKTPSETGVSLLTRYSVTQFPFKEIDVNNVDLPYDLSQYKVYKVNYDTQRFCRKTKKVFVKGIITDIVEGNKTYKINDADNTSYLISKDGSLDKLNVGDEVRCQVNLIDKWSGVTNVIQGYNKILTGGEVIDYNGITNINTDYVNAIKNRTIMGFKADGSPVMMNVEKGTYGASYEECGEFLKAVGCVEGYLFDGGGSSCMFVRNNEGTFDLINTQEDGNERSDGNAIFFVVPDPGFTLDVKDVERFSSTIDLNIVNNEFFKNVSNIKVTVAGVTKDYNNAPVKFDNLEENKEYEAVVSYDMKKHNDDAKTVKCNLKIKFTTKDFEMPKDGLSVKEIGHNFIKVEKDQNLSTASWITNVKIHIDKEVYNMNDDVNFTCDKLFKDTEYEVYFEYTVVDPVSKKEYPVTKEAFKVRTLPFEIPSIGDIKEKVKTNSTLSLNFEYFDNDNKVTKAAIFVNGKEYKALTSKKGLQTLTGLDFENNNYEIKMVIEYESFDGKTITLESNTLTYQMPKPVEPEKPAKKCGKKGVIIIIECLTAASVLGLCMKKKH